MSDVNTKLTALAGEVRELSGTTTPKSIDAMISDIDIANTEVGTQADLIAQISSALQGKAAGGSGILLPELTNEGTAADMLIGKELIDGEGNVVIGTFTIDEELTTQETLLSDQDAKLAELAEILSNKASVSPVLQSKTITPTASEQTVTADSGYDGLRTVTVNGDENLISENIAEGVSIFGVEGSHSGRGAQIASVYVDATNGTTFKYIGANGLETLVDTATTVQMTVPSIAFAQSYGYFENCSIENNGSILLNNYTNATFYINGSTSINASTAPSGGGGSM